MLSAPCARSRAVSASVRRFRSEAATSFFPQRAGSAARICTMMLQSVLPVESSSSTKTTVSVRASASSNASAASRCSGAWLCSSMNSIHRETSADFSRVVWM